MKKNIYSLLGLILTAGISLQGMDFSDYLKSVTFQEFPVSVKKDRNTSFSVSLKSENSHTALVPVSEANPTVQYLFIAFSTHAKTNLNQYLPDELQNELRQKLPKKDVNTVLKIYRTDYDNPSLWQEVASIDTEKNLDDSLMRYVHINKMYINKKGDLIIEYQNIKNDKGKNIKKMRVTYARK